MILNSFLYDGKFYRNRTAEYEVKLLADISCY